MKYSITERGTYNNHKEHSWEFSNTVNRREVVRRYSKIKYTESQAKYHFENYINTYPLV